MSIKSRLRFKIKRSWLWPIGLGLAVAACLTLAVLIWMSGTDETLEAFTDGRRLLIRLEDGGIEGKHVTLEEKPAPAASETPGQSAAEGADAAVEQDIPAVTPAATPPAAPDAALSETVGDMTLPKIGADGKTRPWQAYAKPYERKGNLPLIAIIVTGLGQSKSVSADAITLPEHFSLSFSPYAHDIGSWASSARLAGHETLIDLPLEPNNFPTADPGPYGLLTGKTAEENYARLKWLMSRYQGYVGFLSPQNEIFSTDSDAFKALLQEIDRRGMMMVIGADPAKSETKQILEAGTAPNVVADMLIDEELSPTAIAARLESLQKIASRRGYAIGVAQAYPLSIQQLKEWSQKLGKNGYTLAPVTFIVKLKFPS